MKIPKIPKSLLKLPRGFKKPRVEDFLSDMQRLGEDLAEGFKETLVENIETNKYKFVLAPSTVKQKGDPTPLIDTHQLVDAIYRKGTLISVKDTPRDDSPLTNKELAIVQEYGTKDKHIPARPVWRNTFRDYKPVAHEQVEEFLKTQKFKTKKK